MKQKIAIIGVGRWGKNLLREFSAIADVAYCVHKEKIETTKWLKEKYPNIQTTTYDDVLADTTVSAVVIATPIKTHFELAYKALESGKHIFLEKPGCESSEQLGKLIALAKEKRLGLQIGYVFLYHPALKYLKEHIKDPITSITCSWEKFGSFDEEITNNLVCHDLSILHELKKYTASKKTLLYTASGISTSDIVGIRIDYTDESHATIAINRISTNKKKSLTIVTREAIWFWEGSQIFKSINGKPYNLVFENTASPLFHECTEFISMINSAPKIINGDLSMSIHKSLDSL